MTSDTETLWLFPLLSKCTSLAFFSFFFLLFLLKSIFLWSHPGGPAWANHNVIPGPRGLPFIGSMLLMTGLAHRKIAASAQAYGAKRLMAFSLGQTRVIVTCHPDVAKEILNGSTFVDRPVKESARILMFDRAIGFAPYGAYWRTLRRIAAMHLFCPKQMKASERQRKVISDEMVEIMHRKRESICVRDLIRRASLCNMIWSVFGRKYRLDSNDVQLLELRKLVDEGYEVLGTCNWTDHLPWLAEFDPQGIRFRCSNLLPKVKRFVNRIIQEHRAQTSEVSADFTHVLLSLQGSDRLSDSDMIAVLWEMIFRGTDTVAVMMEWILARLVLHPDVQSRIQEELDRVVGRYRPIRESDIANLVHLPALVKEVLRLHPPGPLLSWARMAISDTTVDGHHVAAGTTAMVNMWAISRDPHLWKEPSEFRSERFAKDFSVMGSDLRLAPFGSGRRSCPGKNLGLTTVSFWVASLLQEFELDGNNVDLTEVLKLSCEMANPLILNVRPRRTSTTSFL
ncbi:hypothetical protein L2E82_45989 [Cichorium intybus]|uniref:Uncharacterized protein n=1 Tax=Cichorium intybus TaxID=13427 RepID=A0ACB8ZYW8_CICIN|nr:hypothetical protein L2E82_45989 [Cichorium intybus]